MNPLTIALAAVPSSLPVTGGGEIAFARAILSLRNVGGTTLLEVDPHAVLSQEGGSSHDATAALGRPRGPLGPGEAVEWDVYELLLSADAAVASKVHFWGHKAVLNWKFHLSAWAEYQAPGGPGRLRTPTRGWTLLWTPAAAPAEGVQLSIEPADG